MFRRDSDLPPRLRSLLYRPIFYRVRALDLFLPAIAFVSGLGFALRGHLLAGDTRILMLVFFAALALTINRAAWLLAGRGRLLPKRIRYALTLLLAEPSLELLPFCLRARIPWEVCARELDRVMTDTYSLGYLNYEKMEIVVTGSPIADKRCPVCGVILSDSMVVERVCGLCGTAFYI